MESKCGVLESQNKKNKKKQNYENKQNYEKRPRNFGSGRISKLFLE